MLAAGEDARFIARRLVILASEDVGMADPLALVVAEAAAGGMPLTNTRALGDLLYTRYVFAFQTAGVILLVAMIGAIVLTLRQRGGQRRQVISTQLARTRASSVEVVKVPLGGKVEAD